MSSALIPAPSKLFAKQVVPVEPEEMEPFYERDHHIRAHREAIERLKVAKAEYEAQQDATIDEMQDIVCESLRIIGMMRQKVKAAKSRIAACTDRKKNAAHNFQIHRRQQAIERQKIIINRRESGKTAKAMANQIFKQMKTKIARNQSRKLPKPNIQID